MSTGIHIIDRVVIAVGVQVQAIDSFGVDVGSIVGGDKSAPLGAIVSGVAEVEASIGIVDVLLLPIFYHFPHPQSRKKPHPDGCGKMIG